MYKIIFYFLFVFVLNSMSYAEKIGGTFRLATSTSTENSGLLKEILPIFEKKYGYRIHVIAVGTGKALRMGEDGDVDVLLVHAPKSEMKFMSKNYGVDRTAVMHNDFVLVGPKSDPAKVKQAKTLTAALRAIATVNMSVKHLFISRGDDSGTHKKELSLWELANLRTDSTWYREAGQGMGKVLQIAGELNAYTLVDRGTWLTYQGISPLNIVFEGDKILFNPYHIIAVNPERHSHINAKGAKLFINWMVSNAGQKMIADFKLNDQPLFIPDAK